MRRILASLIAVFVCLMAMGQAFTPLRPFIPAVAASGLPFSAQYWWVSSDIPVGNTVTNWIDRIAAFPATSTLSANQPTNTATGIFFSGSTWLTNNPYNANLCGSAASNATLCVIFTPSANLDFAGIVTFGHSGNDGYGFWSRTVDQFNYNSGAIVNGHTYCKYATNSVYDVCIVTSTGTSSRMYTNGVFVADHNDLSFGNFEQFGGGSGLNNFRGYVYEIISFSTNMSDSAVATIHSYATNKYG